MWLPDDGPRTETCRSVFNILMCTLYKFYICAVVGIIIEYWTYFDYMYPKITWKITYVHKVYSSQKRVFSRDAPPCSDAVLCFFHTTVQTIMLLTPSRSLIFIQAHDRWFGSVIKANVTSVKFRNTKNEGRMFFWNVGTNLHYTV